MLFTRKQLQLTLYEQAFFLENKISISRCEIADYADFLKGFLKKKLKLVLFSFSFYEVENFLQMIIPNLLVNCFQFFSCSHHNMKSLINVFEFTLTNS